MTELKGKTVFHKAPHLTFAMTPSLMSDADKAVAKATLRDALEKIND